MKINKLFELVGVGLLSFAIDKQVKTRAIKWVSGMINKLIDELYVSGGE